MHRLIRQSHWFILVLGAAVTVWAAIYVDAQIERKAQDSFVLRVQDMEAAIVSRLRRYEDILFGVSGLFRATGHVTPEQFDTYADTLFTKDRFPALDAINYAQYVTRSEKEVFLHDYKADTEGRGGEPVLRDRDEYMVLTRVYPPSLNMVLGVDVLATTGMRVAIVDDGDDRKWPKGWNYSHNQAYSSGMPILTKGKRKPVMAARLGVYKGDRLIGTSGIGFEISTFFKEAVPEKLANTLHYVVHSTGRDNGFKFAKPMLVFDSGDIGVRFNPDEINAHDLLHAQFDIRFGGVIFTVAAISKKEIQDYEKYLPSAVLLFGFLTFAGISLLIQRIMSNNSALDAAVSKRTLELQCEINSRCALEKELAAVIESERTRIGRELHDDLGQRLTAISVSAAVVAAKMDGINADLAAQVNDIGTATHDAMTQIRTLAHGLMPVSSDRKGLMEALEQLAESTSKASILQCSFDFDAPIDFADESVAAHLYRIAQEALNNVIRHSDAKLAVIRLDEVDGKIVLSIQDDGRGFDKTRNTSGLGLSTIAHRASVIGYDLSIITAPGKGTTIKVIEC